MTARAAKVSFGSCSNAHVLHTSRRASVGTGMSGENLFADFTRESHASNDAVHEVGVDAGRSDAYGRMPRPEAQADHDSVEGVVSHRAVEFVAGLPFYIGPKSRESSQRPPEILSISASESL